MPRVIQVIESEEIRGSGKFRDPCRRVMQYYTLDGVLLAEYDPCKESEVEDNANKQ